MPSSQDYKDSQGRLSLLELARVLELCGAWLCLPVYTESPAIKHSVSQNRCYFGVDGSELTRFWVEFGSCGWQNCSCELALSQTLQELSRGVENWGSSFVFRSRIRRFELRIKMLTWGIVGPKGRNNQSIRIWGNNKLCDCEFSILLGHSSLYFSVVPETADYRTFQGLGSGSPPRLNPLPKSSGVSGSVASTSAYIELPANKTLGRFCYVPRIATFICLQSLVDLS